MTPAEPSRAGTLITVAPTGAEVAKADAPQLPTTLEELVETARRCEQAGAALIHVHVRDADHAPTLDPGLLRATVDGADPEQIFGGADGKESLGLRVSLGAAKGPYVTVAASTSLYSAASGHSSSSLSSVRDLSSTLRPRLRISLTSTLKLSGMPASKVSSPRTIAS